jgi:hypothetical protein
MKFKIIFCTSKQLYYLNYAEWTLIIDTNLLTVAMPMSEELLVLQFLNVLEI